MGSSGVGYVACVIAGLGFGSNFIPVKKFEVGDGVFFQWVMCCAIWCVGLFTIAFEDDRNMHPIAMLGGFLWCIGNVMCVQVIRLIGMSMGLMVWGITNSVAGWACGKFGLFNIGKDHIAHPTLNYVGLCLTVASLAFFSHVKPSVSNKAQASSSSMKESLLSSSPSNEHNSSASFGGNTQKKYREIESLASVAPEGSHVGDRESDQQQNQQGEDWVSGLAPNVRMIVGFAGACVCGVLFGFSFAPALWERHHGGTQKQFDYVFSHFCGIFLTSTVIMLVYSIAKKNKPVVDGRLFLPAFASGILWAIAQVMWFLAIQELGGLVVANPIVTCLPSAVAGFWGILLFREIEGTKNLLLFFGGLLLATVGVVLVALSK